MADGDYNIRYRADDPSGRRSIFKSKVSWGAIFAGALVAIAVQLVLSVLGLAIGASAINPATGEFEGLGIGAALWWVVTALISLFSGAWVASRMASISNSFEGMMHGIIVWCVATFIGFLMITTTLGQIMSGAFGVVGQTIAVAGEAAPEAAQALQQQGQEEQQEDQALEGIMSEMRQLMADNNQNQNQQQQESGPRAQQQQQQQQSQQGQEMERAINQLLREGDISSQQRQEVVSMLQENTEMDRQDAQQTVDNWISTYQEATGNGGGIDTEEVQEQAAEVGDDVADALATAAFWSFIALVLGAIVAGVGGSMAAPTEEEIRDRDRYYSDRGREHDIDVIDRRSDIDRSREREVDKERGAPTTFERDPNDPTYRSTSERRGQEPGKTNPVKNEPRMPGDPNPNDPRGKRGRNL